MANEDVKFRRGESQNLPEVEDGQILFETDTGKLYIDNDVEHIAVKDDTKVPISGEVQLENPIYGPIIPVADICDGSIIPAWETVAEYVEMRADDLAQLIDDVNNLLHDSIETAYTDFDNRIGSLDAALRELDETHAAQHGDMQEEYQKLIEEMYNTSLASFDMYQPSYAHKIVEYDKSGTAVLVEFDVNPKSVSDDCLYPVSTAEYYKDLEGIFENLEVLTKADTDNFNTLEGNISVYFDQLYESITALSEDVGSNNSELYTYIDASISDLSTQYLPYPGRPIEQFSGVIILDKGSVYNVDIYGGIHSTDAVGHDDSFVTVAGLMKHVDELQAQIDDLTDRITQIESLRWGSFKE